MTKAPEQYDAHIRARAALLDEAMRAANAATVRGKRKGEVYVSRKEGDGHRIWRVA